MQHRSKFYEDKRAGKFTFLTCIWFAYGALLKQGTTAAPIGGSFPSSTIYSIFFFLLFFIGLYDIAYESSILYGHLVK